MNSGKRREERIRRRQLLWAKRGRPPPVSEMARFLGNVTVFMPEAERIAGASLNLMPFETVLETDFG